MPQRSDQRARDADTDVSDLLDGESGSESTTAAADSGGVRGRVRERAGRIFSPRFFLLALAAMVLGMVVGGTVVPVFGSFGGFLGIFGAAFALGLVGHGSRLVETGAAGATAAGASWLLNNPVLATLGGLGVSLGVLGAGAGLIAGVLGAYFGGDLRKGVTRDI